MRGFGVGMEVCTGGIGVRKRLGAKKKKTHLILAHRPLHRTGRPNQPRQEDAIPRRPRRRLDEQALQLRHRRRVPVHHVLLPLVVRQQPTLHAALQAIPRRQQLHAQPPHGRGQVERAARRRGRQPLEPLQRRLVGGLLKHGRDVGESVG